MPKRCNLRGHTVCSPSRVQRLPLLALLFLAALQPAVAAATGRVNVPYSDEVPPEQPCTAGIALEVGPVVLFPRGETRGLADHSLGVRFGATWRFGRHYSLVVAQEHVVLAKNGSLPITARATTRSRDLGVRAQLPHRWGGTLAEATLGRRSVRIEHPGATRSRHGRSIRFGVGVTVGLTDQVRGLVVVRYSDANLSARGPPKEFRSYSVQAAMSWHH